MTCSETGLRVRASPHRTTVRLEQSRDGGGGVREEKHVTGSFTQRLSEWGGLVSLIHYQGAGHRTVSMGCGYSV